MTKEKIPIGFIGSNLPKCPCGDYCKNDVGLASTHHYWYFHKAIVPKCRYCNPKRNKRKIINESK